MAREKKSGSIGRHQVSLLVLAAGIGSRYGGLKQLEGIGPRGETLMDYSLHDACSAGFKHVVFVIRRELYDVFQEKIVPRWKKRLTIEYAYQEVTSFVPETFEVPAERKKPWGTGHAVLCSRRVIHNPFVVVNADDYYGKGSLQTAFNYLKELQPGDKKFLLVSFPLGQTLSLHGTVSRGVCKVDQSGCLVQIQEHRDLCQKDNVIYSGNAIQKGVDDTTPVSMNLWGFTPQIYNWLSRRFQEFFITPQRNFEKDEYTLPELIHAGIKAGEFTVSVLPTQDQWLGITYREDLTWVKQKLPTL